jgi:aryl-alcohol dehydrogenase-like predicted oxidoreductase
VKYRQLGETGIEVSEIGYGAWGIGGDQWGGADDDESIQALHRAIDLGLNFIDTALAYGDGRSERLVGQVVRERPETVFVATKVPPKNRVWPAQAGVPVDEVFPADYVRACAQTSLANLGLERVDLLQFHVWSDEWLDQGDWREAIADLRAAAKIGFFGVSINDHQPDTALRLVESGLADTVQVIYNVFDQSPEDELFPTCRAHGVGVIARVPLDEGGLTGTIQADSEFPDGDFRANYFRGDRKREVHERVTAVVDDIGISEDEVAEIALRFVLSEPAVSTVIPGVPDGWREKLRAHRWVRDFYR